MKRNYGNAKDIRLSGRISKETKDLIESLKKKTKLSEADLVMYALQELEKSENMLKCKNCKEIYFYRPLLPSIDGKLEIECQTCNHINNVE